LNIAAAALLLALALDSSRISASRCHKTFLAGSASHYKGQADWQDQADGSIVGSTEYRTVGRSVMSCVVKLPIATKSAVLDFRGARVSFVGAKSGGGLEVIAHHGKSAPVCTLPGMRVSREDWIELGPAQYALNFDQPVDRITVAFTLTDVSDASEVRVDIQPVSIRERHRGDTPKPCPPAL